MDYNISTKNKKNRFVEFFEYIMIKTLYFIYGADKRYKMFGGKTLLMYAAYKNNKKAVLYLIDRGADVKIKDYKGNMALDYAKDNEEIKRPIKTILKGKWKVDEIEEADLSCDVKDQYMVEEQYMKELHKKDRNNINGKRRNDVTILDLSKASTSSEYPSNEQKKYEKNKY